MKKKLAYLLTCLSLPLAGLFILLSLLGQASAARPAAASLPVELDYGGMETASLAATDAGAKDAPLALASEAALLAPKSSPALNPASASQEGDVAGEIISVVVDPAPVVAGEQATFAVTIRNTGATTWDPTGVEAEVIVVDEDGTKLASGWGSDALPFEAVASRAETSVVAYLQVPRAWQGTYRYTVKLWYMSALVDSHTEEDALLEVGPAEGPIEARDNALQREEHLVGMSGGQAVDIVFAMDTSGSMNDEFSTLCSKIDEIITDLQSWGITVRYKILGILYNRDCTSDTVSNVIPGGRTNQYEDWGPATYDLSYGYGWAPDLVRMIIPMSDEGPENGEPCQDPGPDRDAISAAIEAAQANNVIVSPVLCSHTWSYACLETLARDLANGTGGRFFESTDPSSDLAAGIADLVQGATKPDPKGEQGPLEPEPPLLYSHLINEPIVYYLDGLKVKTTDNGARDEGFTWTHPAVTFDDEGRPSCDDNCLRELRLSYQESISEPLTIDIPITRYYGKTDGNHHLTEAVRTNVIQSAKIGVLVWDIDPWERVSLSIDSHRLSRHLSGIDGKWHYDTFDIPVEHLLFPSDPGSPSDPTTSDPNNPLYKPGRPISVTNRITVEFDPPYKALIAGARLIIEAVRPVVLVPGFGADASGYGWGEVENTLEISGVIVKRPCHYQWEYKRSNDPENTPHAWYLGVFDRDKGYDDVQVPVPTPVPDDTSSLVHRRCFEAARATGEERNDIGTLDKNADALMRTIEELRIRYGVDKVNLVGHSKGGLFSRAYVDIGEYQEDVENLISISSPHQGLFVMDLAVPRDTDPNRNVELPDDWSDRIQCGGILRNVLCRWSPSNMRWTVRKGLDNHWVDFKPDDIAGQEISTIGVDDKFGDAGPARGVTYHSIVATAGNADDPSSLDPDHDTMKVWNGVVLKAFSVAYRMNYFLGDLTEDNPRHEFFQSIEGQSDIPITTVSQRMDKLAGYGAHLNSCTGIRANHDESSKIDAAANAVAKALGLNYDDSGLLNCDNVMRAQPTASTERASTNETAFTNGGPPEHVLSFSGVITYGQTAEVPFDVDGSNLQTIALWNGDANVTLTLSDPNGAAITPTVAAGDDNMDYYEERDAVTGFGDAIYTITDTVKGRWTANVVAPETGGATEPIQWDLIVSQRSPISFTLSTIPLTVTFGNSLTLRATPVTDTLPILGASIEGEVRSWTGITQSLTLADDGLHDDFLADDGVYGAHFTPSQAGEYVASATMSGTLPSGIPYMRQDEIRFTVLPMSAHFTDIYTDTGIDEDGDGLFDELRLQVEVSVDRDGKYMLFGKLSTPEGTSLGTASKLISETAGTLVTVNLDFDAALLVDRPADGPVVLGKLSLRDQSAGLRTDYRENAYTTQSYSRLDFAGWEVLMAGSFSDQGVDTNDNGKFEYLEVQVPLEVRRSGTYTATAVLEMSSGDAIIAPQAVFSTTSSFAPVTTTFHFNGPTIAISAVDGPYTVTNMMVQGPLGLALFKHEIGQTALYSYLDFEADTVAPTSTIEPLPAVITTTPVINVPWSGSDPEPSSGIAFYDVQYKVGSTGNWTDWLTQTVLTNYPFGPTDPITVTSGETYYFQVRASDYAGNQETYPGGDGDAHTTMLGVDLQVDKSASTDFIQEHTADYSINYRNDGPVAANNVALTDTLPSGLSYVADTSGITSTVAGNTVVWSLGTVPPYANRSFNLTTYVSPTLVGGSLITNTLDISTPDQESNYANNSAAASTTVITATSDMYVEKWLYSGTPMPGGDFQYRIRFRNYGNSDATNVIVTDTLPISTTYVSDSNSEGFTTIITGSTVVWTHPSVPSGDYGYLYLTVHISDTLFGGETLTNTVQASTNRPETDYINNTYTDTQTVQPRMRDMRATKSLDSGTPAPGNEIEYRIYYQNQGNTSASDIVITDTLPVSTTYVSDHNSAGFTTVITGSTVVWTRPEADPGASGYLYLLVSTLETANPGEVLTNVVEISTSDVDVDPSNDVYTDTRTVEAPTQDMYVSKSLDEGNATPGNNLTYEIYYRNHGNSPAADVVITDTLPVSTTYLSFSGSFTPTISGNQLVWNLGTVSGSGYTGYYGYLYATVHLSEQVPIGTVLTNTAEIATSDTETNYDNNTDLDTRTVVTGAPDLRLYKYFESSEAPQGSEVIYRLYYYNYNYDAAIGVTITDTLPVSVTYVSSTGAPEPTVSGNQVAWHLPFVPGKYQPGYEDDIYLTTYISDSVSVGTVLTNTAVITTPNDTNPANNADDDARTVVAGSRDLQVEKWMESGNGAAGSDVTYKIHYRNIGNASTANVVITDTLPLSTTYVSHSGAFTPTVVGNNVIWDLGTVPGQYTTGYEGDLYVTAYISESTPADTMITNTVTIATSQTEIDYTNNVDDLPLLTFSKTADILFVPDYGGNDTDWFQPYFTNALDSLDYSYDVWDTGLRGKVYSDTLSLYTDGVVIWAVPYWGYFDDSDVRPDIEAYLDAGGKLFITGQNVAEYLNDRTLLNDYLHATYVQDDTDLYALNGTAGDPIGDGLTLDISGGDGANNQGDTDEIDPISPVVTVLTYDTSAVTALAEPVKPEVTRPEREGSGPGAEKLADAEPAAGLQGIVSSGTGGLRVDTGAYKVVFFSFGFEGINSAGDRALVMERVLAWLRGVLPRPTQISPADGSAVPVGDVTFTWNSVAEASGYQIQIDTSAAFSSTDLISDTVTSNSYTATLSLGTWYWQVRALPDGLWTTAWELRGVEPVVQVSTGGDSDSDAVLAMTAGGELVSVWQRNGELWTARSIDSGATWSVSTQLAECCRYQPAMLRMADDSLWLVYTHNNDIWYRTSSDSGLTWSPEVQLTTHTADDHHPDLAQTADGRIWILWDSARGSGSNIWYETTADNGVSWTPGTELPVESGWNENPTMTQAPDGTLWVIWFRGYSLAYSTSTDGGNTWSPLDVLDAGGAVHGPSLRRATDGTLWLVYPVTRHEAGQWRTNLYYQTSTDSGGTWSGPRQFTFFVGDNSEPAVVPMNDDRMGLAWHSNRTGVPKIWFGIPGLREDINPPPHVSGVEHVPSPNPNSDDTITVRGWAQDETGRPSVELVWGINGVGQASLPMYDDGAHNDAEAGDGQYGVQIGPLSAGSSVTYTVQATDVDGNSYTYPETGSFQVEIPSRDLSVYKWLEEGAPVAGQLITYTIYVDNEGNFPVSNVVVTDTLPFQTSYISDYNYSGFTTVLTGNTVVWTKDSLSEDSSAWLYLAGYISDTVPMGTVLTNTVQASTSDEETDYADNLYIHTLTTIDPRVDMRVYKNALGGAPPGGSFTYELAYQNAGGSPAADVVITDTLPQETVYLSCLDCLPPTVEGNQLVWDLETVPPTQWYYWLGAVTVEVSETVAPGAVLTNVIEVSTTSEESDYTNNVYSYAITVPEPFSKTASILVVLDNGGYDTSWFAPYYTGALDALGCPYDVWDTGLRGEIDSTTLNQYADGAVIWGAPDWGYLSNSDTRNALKNYLDAGGKLFISGQDVGYSIGSTSFYADYLHAIYVQDDPGLRELEGVNGDPISDGLSFSIVGGDGADNQYYPDEIDPVSPAVTIFTYSGGALARSELRMLRDEEREPFVEPRPPVWEGRPTQYKMSNQTRVLAEPQGVISSGSGAIRVDTGTYKAVYFAFGFEAINSAADRQLVIERVLDWTWLLFGDLDFNCVVNVADVQRVASRWRMTDTDPDWNPRYDLNGDGIITVVDIMKVVAHWGEACE